MQRRIKIKGGARVRFKLLPCAPCDLDGVEEWINDEQKDGWRLERFGLLLPFMAFSAPDEGGGEYTISLEHTGEESERVCVLRDVGYVVKGKPRGGFDDAELKAASRKVGRNFITMVVPYVLVMNFERRFASAGDLAIGLIACLVALAVVGAYFLLIHDPAKTPRGLGLAMYILGTVFIRLWLLLLVIALVIAIP